MRHTCIGALTLERGFLLQHPHTRACITVTLLTLFVSAEATASSKFERDSLIFRERVIVPGPLVVAPNEADRDAAPAAAGEFGPHNLYSEAYWNAVSEIDLDGSRRAARNRAELEFARGLSLLAAGDRDRAETAFAALSTDVSDVNVAVASQIMLAHTLLYEQKWSLLRDLPRSPTSGVADTKNTVEIERWGRAFANTEAQAVAFPSQPVSVPLRRTRVGTPAISVKINGREYTFWLDTGSSMTVLSSAVAEKTRTPIISGDTLAVRTFAGTAAVRAALVRKIELGSIVLTNSPVIVMDASMMRVKGSGDGAPWANHYVDGIIGWDIIRQLDVLLDFERDVATFGRPERLHWDGASPRNLMWLGRPLVEVRTKRGEKLHLALDTGAQTTLLNAASVEKLGMSSRPAEANVFGIARTGTPSNRMVPSLSLEIDGNLITLEDVIVYGPTYSGLIVCDGILGSDIAQFGTVRIDATNGILSVGQ